MKSINKVILVGRVGKDPSIKEFNDGKRVASFSLATSERYLNKNSNSYMETTEWHNINVFSEPLIKFIASSISKGALLYVEGALKNREYLTKSGEKRRICDIYISGFNSSLVLLESKTKLADLSESAREPQTDTRNEKDLYDEEFVDDQIPF